MDDKNNEEAKGAPLTADRRELLLKYGKFAVITPAAVTLMLSNPMGSRAVASSGGTHQQGSPPSPPYCPPPPPPPPPPPKWNKHKTY
jgi:hypothetical protein